MTAEGAWTTSVQAGPFYEDEAQTKEASLLLGLTKLVSSCKLCTSMASVAVYAKSFTVSCDDGGVVMSLVKDSPISRCAWLTLTKH